MKYSQATHRWYPLPSDLSCSSLRLLLASIVLISLVGCSPVMSGLSSLTGSGTNVAANTQLGQQNNQTLGTSETTTNTFKVNDVESVEVTELDQSSGDNQVDAKKVDTVNIDNGSSPWLWVAFVVALLADSPARWPRQVLNGIRRFRNRNK